MNNDETPIYPSLANPELEIAKKYIRELNAVSAQYKEQLAEAQRERDEAREHASAYAADSEHAEAERDAARADVERLTEALEGRLGWILSCAEGIEPVYCPTEADIQPAVAEAIFGSAKLCPDEKEQVEKITAVLIRDEIFRFEGDAPLLLNRVTIAPAPVAQEDSGV